MGESKLEVLTSPLISQELLDKMRAAFPAELASPAVDQYARENQLFKAGGHYALKWLEQNCVRRSVNGHAKT
jgi:hypothetical protein